MVLLRLPWHLVVYMPMSPSKSNNEEVIYRTLGKTGLEVPVVSMGVMRADNPKSGEGSNGKWNNPF